MRKYLGGVMICCLFVLNGCALYTSKPVTDAANSGKLVVGMSPDEARKVLGSADEVAKQIINEHDIKEVWIYYEYDPNIRSCSLACMSCSRDLFVPLKAKLKYVIFHNEKLIGWNLPDPFVDDLLLQEREQIEETGQMQRMEEKE